MSPDHDLLAADALQARFGQAVRIGDRTEISAETIFEIETGAFLQIGNGVTIRRGTTIQVSRHATLVIEDDVAIGENVFISALVGIRVGRGVGISNMVDIHDVNHRSRSIENLDHEEWTPWASGFEGAPIIIESGAVISNKCSIAGGVRIGYNSIVGANSVVTRCIPPNTVATGAPASPRRSFEGVPPTDDDVRELRIGLFGTSIMEHLEGYAGALHRQWDLPEVGTVVEVESWQMRGYAHRLYLALQVDHPHMRFRFVNNARGGYTSRDIRATVSEVVESEPRMDLAIFECGINDVWRRFQGRTTEAVDRDEYEANYRGCLQLLRQNSRKVICIGQTPVSDEVEDALAINAELRDFNRIGEGVARTFGVPFIDVWQTFRNVAGALSRAGAAEPERPSAWSDGVHLSDFGDTVIHSAILRHLVDNRTVAELERYEFFERDLSTKLYAPLFAHYRSTL